ncbi:hypothetical protein ACJMK2_028534 [Sinanodonta woodiana]|uniref:Uncharacterized protein n=1 Tax=Sinanodonta woodiana TaxID=1069815 RepID=A0ABD3X955_SINWO
MKEIHIRNVGYPRQIQYCNVTSGYLATIQSSSGAMVIRALDLRLAFNGAERCGQKLHIAEGDRETDITCYDNNNFKETTLYNSTTDNITIRIDNTLSNESGNLWIKVTGKVLYIIKVSNLYFLVFKCTFKHRQYEALLSCIYCTVVSMGKQNPEM